MSFSKIEQAKTVGSVVQAWSQNCNKKGDRTTAAYIQEMQDLFNSSYFKSLKPDIAEALMTCVNSLTQDEKISQADGQAVLQFLLEQGKANAAHARLLLSIYFHHNPAAYERLSYTIRMIDARTKKSNPDECIKTLPVYTDFSLLSLTELRNLLRKHLDNFDTGHAVYRAEMKLSSKRTEGFTNAQFYYLCKDLPPIPRVFKSKKAISQHLANLDRPDLIQELTKHFNLKVDGIDGKTLSVPIISTPAAPGILSIPRAALSMMSSNSAEATTLDVSSKCAKCFSTMDKQNIFQKSCGCGAWTHVYCPCACKSGTRKRPYEEMSPGAPVTFVTIQQQLPAPYLTVDGKRKKKLRGGLGQDSAESFNT